MQLICHEVYQNIQLAQNPLKLLNTKLDNTMLASGEITYSDSMELSPSPLVTTPDSIISRRVFKSEFFFCRSTITEFKNSTWPKAESLSSVNWLPASIKENTNWEQFQRFKNSSNIKEKELEPQTVKLALLLFKIMKFGIAKFLLYEYLEKRPNCVYIPVPNIHC